MHIGPYELANRLVVAPMAGVTDPPFRRLCRRLGAGHAVGEMVGSRRDLWATGKTMRRTDHAGEPAPVTVQIVGTEPVEMAEAARHNIERGAQIVEGTLDMAYFGDAWLAADVPYLSMLGAVYTFSGWDHANRVLNGDIGRKIYEDVAVKTGVRPLGAFYLGTRQLNLRDIGKEVRTPQDMKGVKLRTPASPSWIALGKALGGNPTPMSFGEVYMGLKTGAIDGQDNPLPTDKNAKFYEVTKYIILTNHVIGTVWPTINEKKWQSL